MNTIARNVIAWNRNAIRRATRSLERARSPEQREGFRRDIHRFENNILILEAA